MCPQRLGHVAAPMSPLRSLLPDSLHVTGGRVHRGLPAAVRRPLLRTRGERSISHVVPCTLPCVGPDSLCLQTRDLIDRVLWLLAGITAREGLGRGREAADVRSGT